MPDDTLVVAAPFGAYARGDKITDPEQVKAALAGNAAHVRLLGQPPPAEVPPPPPVTTQAEA